VAVVQYTFTHKQYIEQHNSLIRRSADRAPSLRGVPWHLPYTWGKSTEKPQSGYTRWSVVRVAGECQLAKSIQNRAYLSIRIHKHNKSLTVLPSVTTWCLWSLNAVSKNRGFVVLTKFSDNTNGSPVDNVDSAVRIMSSLRTVQPTDQEMQETKHPDRCAALPSLVYHAGKATEA